VQERAEAAMREVQGVLSSERAESAKLKARLQQQTKQLEDNSTKLEAAECALTRELEARKADLQEIQDTHKAAADEKQRLVDWLKTDKETKEICFQNRLQAVKNKLASKAEECTVYKVGPWYSTLLPSALLTWSQFDKRIQSVSSFRG
jgi:chromosome segregation ATPase